MQLLSYAQLYGNFQVYKLENKLTKGEYLLYDEIGRLLQAAARYERINIEKGLDNLNEIDGVDGFEGDLH